MLSLPVKNFQPSNLLISFKVQLSSEYVLKQKFTPVTTGGSMPAIRVATGEGE